MKNPDRLLSFASYLSKSSACVFAGAMALAFPLFAHEAAKVPEVAPNGERILSLESTHTIKRDGRVDVEVEFDLVSEGISVKRGPCLNLLKVYRGPMGLVLDNGVEVTGVWRNGAPESYFEDEKEFQTALYVGGRDRLLEPGNHSYRVKYTMQGDWRKAGNHFMGAFDMVGAFNGLPIEKAVAHLKFPEGVSVERFSSSVTGIASSSPAYETTQVVDGLRVETHGVMEKDRSFFINAIWPADSFASQSQWVQVLVQHRRLPVTLFAAIFLSVLLGFVLVRIFGRHRAVTAAA